MNLNKLIVGVALALVLAVVVGLVVDNVGFWVVVGLLILALLSMFVDRFVYIRVGEMETAVVFNRETRAFSRFLLPGRHLLKFPLERVTATLSTAPTTANGRCKNAQTQEGVSVDLAFSITYELFPGEAEAAIRPRMARFLPSGTTSLVRSHAVNCVAQVVNHKTVETLCQSGVRTRLERELRDAVQERLRPFGISVYRVMVTSVDLPLQVKTSLEEAHERLVYAKSEACALEQLHLALSQFSDADVDRLLQLRQLREMGQNGVTVHMPYMGNTGMRGSNGNGNGNGQNGNGRSYEDAPIFRSDTPDSRVNGKPYS
ncbi:MAG: SPFH domain-containing protein [Anaerolineae bacterium]|nr:SPFH domain-containing protein [Anaerolineae bacterium]